MPNQYSAADLTNVPRTYTLAGEDSTGTSGNQPGFTSFQMGTFVNHTNFNTVSSRTYPMPSGTGSYSSNTGDRSPSGVNFAVHVGYGVDTINWTGYYNLAPLTSGVLGANITHNVTVDPSGLNGGLLDPWLQSDV